MPHVDLERTREIGDAAFLDHQHGAEAEARAAGRRLPVGRLDAKRADVGTVGPGPAVGRDLDRAEADAAAGVRLDQLSARLVQHLPAGGELGVLLHEARQQRIAEPVALAGLKLIAAELPENAGPRSIKDLLA